MSTTYGLTIVGLVIKSIQVIRAEIDAAIRGKLGDIPLGDRTLLGIYDGVLADREASLWQLAQVVYSSGDPDKAAGAALDAICLLTGTLRPQASRSSSTLILGGDAATLIPAGSEVRTATTSIVFATTADATLALCPTWTSLTVYTTGTIVTRLVSGTKTLFLCILAVSGSTPPESDATHWLQVGLGAATATVDVLAEDTGPLEAAATDLNTIVSGISGWKSAYNQLDAVQGRNIATDEELRLLREVELAAPGTSPVDAIRADVLEVATVTTCTVFDNPTDTTNVDGMPPHSVEVLVQGGDDQLIANRIFASVAAGIATTGNIGAPIIVEDSVGIDHNILFSRPTPKQIYVGVALIYDALLYPIDGDAQVQTAIIKAGNLKGAGRDAVSSAIIAACFSIPGVLDVTHAFLGLAPTPTLSTTIAVGTREIATWAEIRITVASTPGTP